MIDKILIVVVCVVLFALYSWIKAFQRRKRACARKYQGYPKPWPIKIVPVEEVSSAFEKGKFGSTSNAEIYFNCECASGVLDRERWVLSVLAKTAKNIFELGTYSGGTTYLLAKNSPKDAKVVTLTLHPDQMSDIVTENADVSRDVKSAIDESSYVNFYYNGTCVEQKIEQIFSDSKVFDVTPYIEKFDLIFIDGSHMYSYVLNDFEKSLKMLKPGGIIVCHDYRGPKRARGVFDALNKIDKDLPLARIEGTTLVFYRKPM